MENIKNKHLARRHDFKRPTPTAVPIQNPEQKDFLNSLFTSANSMASSSSSSAAMENHNHHNIYPSSNEHSSTFYSPSQFDHSQTPTLEDFLSPSYHPLSNHPNSRHSSFLNLSFDDPSSFISQSQDSPTYPY